MQPMQGTYVEYLVLMTRDIVLLGSTGYLLHEAREGSKKM